MSRPVQITKEEIENLITKGFSMKAIAKKYQCAVSTLNFIRRNKEREPDVKALCSECGIEFIGPPHRKTCGSQVCQSKRNMRISQPITADWKSKIRPYSYTSNMLLVEDLEAGWSLERTALMYDRDIDDLKQHIEVIKADGTYKKIQSRLSTYQKERTIIKGSNELI